MVFCSNCGTKLEAETRFCPECGTPVVSSANKGPETSPVQSPASPAPEQVYQQVTKQPYQQVTKQPYQQVTEQPYQQAAEQPYQQAAEQLYQQAAEQPYPQAAAAPAKKNKSRLALYLGLAIFLLLLLAGGLYIFFSGSLNPGSDKLAGRWEAVTIQMSDLELPVSELFSGGFSLELMSRGKYELVIDGEKVRGTWRSKGDQLSLTGGALQTEGLLEGGKLILDDVFGYKLILVQDSKLLPPPTGGTQPKDPGRTDSTSSAAVDPAGPEVWNGNWYGYFWITEGFGEWAEHEDTFLDAYMVVDLSPDGKGTLAVFLEDDDHQTVDAYIKADADHMVVTDGEFWDMPLDPSVWWLATSRTDPGQLLVIADTYLDPELSEEDGFEYQFVLRPFGEVWEMEAAEGKRLPPSYDNYLANLNQGLINPDAGEGGKQTEPAPGGQNGLPEGQFSTEAKSISAAGVTVSYPATATAAENYFGQPSVEFGGGYWMNASLETTYDTIADRMASLELYAGYKNGALYESTFKGKPCVVLMHDTDKENSADASINIYVYIGDKQLVQIDVLSLNGSLAAMLKDQDLWATIHSVSW